MRIPAPAALLADHPVVPVPRIDGAASEAPPTGEKVAVTSLSRRERFSTALQLTAAASLLAEFDLWPGTAAIREARFTRTSSGVRATLGRFPMPMSRVFARLGGGEGAAAATRAAVVKAISDVVGLAPTSLDVGKSEPGFFLEGAIARQLRELKRPLDGCTARALWAIRWDGLPTPDEGSINYWSVPIPDLACRLGGALWATIRRRRGNAWLWTADGGGVGTAPIPAIAGDGTVILVGELSNDELAAVSRWTQRERCSAAVIGGFPSGWHPPRPPSFDAKNPFRHMAITGMPLEDARRVVEQKAGRFDPFSTIDRRALTDAGRRVFAMIAGRNVESHQEPNRNRLQEMLALSPDGLPPGFVALHSGLTDHAIRKQRRELAIVEGGGKWRLASGAPLERNPLHALVADLFAEGDPRRFLHAALGDGETAALETWARARLDELDAFAVRDLLAVVSPGALGHEVGILLAEACLAVCDVSGARRAIAAIPSDRAEALTKWLDGIDDRSGRRRELPGEEQIEFSPRAVAESAILVLNEDRRRGGGRATAAKALIDRARKRVSELLDRRFEIELAWISDSGEFDDPTWRRRVVGDHPMLRAQFVHRRARQLMDRKQTRSACRLLELLVDDRMGPGLLGAVEHDLGAAALDAGRSREADTHQLRAYRLLEAAGFRHVTRRVLFNLAVGDLDQLEIQRAEDRFSELAAEDPGDPYVVGETARLVLAKGDIRRFRQRLGSFAERIDDNDPRFAEALRLLQGVEALIDGDLARARGLLEGAGQEGEAWIGLVDSVTGLEARSWTTDGWGVSLAAELVHGARVDDDRVGAILATGRMTRSRALGVSLAEHVGRVQLPITEAMRVEAVQVLRNGRMDGWADALGGGRGREESVVAALAEIVDRNGPEGLTPELAARLLVALGVSGLELRDATDRSLYWQVGSGTPGTEIRHGRMLVVPLGGEAHEGPTWRLLTGILELFAPAASISAEPEIEETGFHGISAAARFVRRELCELGPTHLAVLLVGETGVGKEVAARALHRLSGRRGAFVPVNVAAIPANLLEAELFGSVKGAFTGADRSRRGLAVAADRGTLFLDEVGDLDPPLQVKLLRFLEDQEVRAVGATQSRAVDVRIVSATHRDLGRRVSDGMFRQDLYYRIAAPPLEIPPLRERREDIGLLRDLFEREAGTRYGLPPCTWSGDAEAMLRQYDWPGNVRELRQAIEVALVRAAGALVRPDHLPITESDTISAGTWDEAQRDFRRKFLRAALARNNGNRSATARELGISRQALLYHIRNLGLSKTGKN